MTNTDSLPILKKLRARQDHLEELRGELRAFCQQANIIDAVDTDDEGNEDAGESVTPTPGRRLPTASSIINSSGHQQVPLRPPTGSVRTRLLHRNGDDDDQEVRNVDANEGSLSSRKAKLTASGLLNGIDSVVGSSSRHTADDHCVGQKSEAVTFQVY